MTYPEKILEKESVAKAAVCGASFYTFFAADRILRLDESLSLANDAGLTQGTLSFVSALTLLTVFDKCKIKSPDILLNIFLSSLSAYANYTMQIDSGGSLIETFLMGGSTALGIHGHDQEWDKQAANYIKNKKLYKALSEMANNHIMNTKIGIDILIKREKETA